MKKLELDLIIERGEDQLSGRVLYKDNLIVDMAATVLQLENQLKQLLFDFEDVDPNAVQFNHLYDVYALFAQFDFLNISKVAKQADINPGLLRQYASGVKNPSATQAKKLEDTLHNLAKQMQNISVYAE